MARSSRGVDSALSMLDRIENDNPEVLQYSHIRVDKHYFNMLKLDLGFLITFLRYYEEEWGISYKATRLRPLVITVADAVKEAEQKISVAYKKHSAAEVAYLMQTVLPTLQRAIRPLKPKIKKAYNYLSTKSNHSHIPSSNYFFWINLVDCLRHNLFHLRFKFPEETSFWVDSLKSNQFPALDHLTELESLKIIYHGRIGRPGEFGFPLNLKKLTLSKFRLPWNCIEEIGRLPNLKVLKLLSKAFEGKIWDMGELEFKELEFLKLDSISFTKWIASSDNQPKLQRLVLRNCKQLEEVPSGFAEIQTLQLIELQLCRHSAEESVKRLKEEQVDLGNEELKVLINLSIWDMKSSQ